MTRVEGVRCDMCGATATTPAALAGWLEVRGFPGGPYPTSHVCSLAHLAEWARQQAARPEARRLTAGARLGG